MPRSRRPHVGYRRRVEDEEVESTGVASVDAALERLADLETAPVEGHVEIFDDVQRRLHDALAELDDGQ